MHSTPTLNCRVLANDNDPVLLETIPSLLERIVDYEDNIIDVVMLIVKCARYTRKFKHKEREISPACDALG